MEGEGNGKKEVRQLCGKVSQPYYTGLYVDGGSGAGSEVGRFLRKTYTAFADNEAPDRHKPLSNMLRNVAKISAATTAAVGVGGYAWAKKTMGSDAVERLDLKCSFSS